MVVDLSVDLAKVQQRVQVVEAALAHDTGPAAERRRLLCIHELDRLAESLVGDQAAEAQEVKSRIQQLLDPGRPAAARRDGLPRGLLPRLTQLAGRLG